MRMSTAATAVVVALALPIGTATAAPRGDDTIDLPAGFAGEGVAVGAGNTFYAGSLAGGHIARGNLRERTADALGDGTDPLPSRRAGGRRPPRSAVGRGRADRPSGGVPPRHRGRRRACAHAHQHDAVVHQRRRRHPRRGVLHEQHAARAVPGSGVAPGRRGRSRDAATSAGPPASSIRASTSMGSTRPGTGRPSSW